MTSAGSEAERAIQLTQQHSVQDYGRTRTTDLSDVVDIEAQVKLASGGKSMVTCHALTPTLGERNMKREQLGKNSKSCDSGLSRMTQLGGAKRNGMLAPLLAVSDCNGDGPVRAEVHGRKGVRNELYD